MLRNAPRPLWKTDTEFILASSLDRCPAQGVTRADMRRVRDREVEPLPDVEPMHHAADCHCLQFLYGCRRAPGAGECVPESGRPCSECIFNGLLGVFDRAPNWISSLLVATRESSRPAKK